MSDQLIKLKGILHWPKLFQPSYDKYKDKNMYSTLFEPDAESLKKLEKIGVPESQLKVREKSKVEGRTITLIRDSVTPQGKPIDAPKVVNEDGKLMDGSVSIGNGTEAEVVVSVYFSKEWSGRPVIRLMGVRVLDLVKYQSGGEILDMLGVEDFSPREEKEDTTEPANDKENLDDLDDEIPF